MRKIAFLRSVGIRRADPYVQQAVRGLAADGIEAGLFHTSGTAGDEDFPGYRERLDRSVTPFSWAVGMVAAPALFTLLLEAGPLLPWAVEAAACLIAVLAAPALKAPNRHRRRNPR